MLDSIIIRGARQHNLKGFNLTLPRNQLVVITGLSGSGKSSLAFDTLYAEGQRRYVESLSAYARQFLDQMEKPDVESITGLSPAIAIEQRSTSGNPRSIVATSTEIFDFLRLLYAHTGTAHCPQCGKTVQAQSPEAICRRIAALPPDLKIMILAPQAEGKKGEHKEIFDKAIKEGFARVRVDGEIVALDGKLPSLDKKLKHTLEIVVDRLKTGGEMSRLTGSVETALRHGEGLLKLLVEDAAQASGWREELISEKLACAPCGLSFDSLQPRHFSFNSPYGACTACHGLGSLQVLDIDLIAPDQRKAVKDAFPLWKKGPRRLQFYYQCLLSSLGSHLGFSIDAPLNSLSESQLDQLLHGTPEPIRMRFKHAGRWYDSEKPFEGVANNITRRMQETDSEAMREKLQQYMVRRPCVACGGKRLNPFSLAVDVGGLRLPQLLDLSIGDAAEFFDSLPHKFSDTQRQISAEILKEIRARLGFLTSVGLHYLSLGRESATLSGGEAQRIRLATQLGSGLVGVLYILDEPSIGLHQRDNELLIKTLCRLRDLGNTVLVVEHDQDTIERADFLVDLGPGAGRLGGELMYAGPPAGIHAVKSATGDYLSGRRRIEVPAERHPGNGKFLKVRGASANNLKDVDADFPLATFTCVTGVSGSGKSTLVNEVLKKHLMKHLGLGKDSPGKCRRVEGMDEVDKLIVIDQSPIGRTPRSNPATYTDAFGLIRDLFAATTDAKVRGYGPGRFSFNVKGGRCEECKGDGVRKIEMNFLPDVHVQCEHCKGRRFNAETLQVRYKGKSIADVLEMTVDDAVEFFSAVPKIKRITGTLQEVGLGYLHLGQAATTLSGGEAQRVKLAAELCRIPRGHTVYILDEPTTGLHIADIHRLLEVLLRIRELGNTVLVIEHNLDVIKVADHLIDMGPEGGSGGGTLVASGTPEEVALCPESHTGRFLKPLLPAENLRRAQNAPKTKAKPASSSDSPWETESRAKPVKKNPTKADRDQLDLGPTTNLWLATLGITLRSQVAERGPVAICVELKKLGHPVSLNLAYALQGAINGCAWNQLAHEAKDILEKQFRAAMSNLAPSAKALEVAESAEAPVKRKPGRPKKAAAPVVEVAAPKKRGRPKKA
ncbi:MAG: hypothetical protein RL095_2709 [Verrucomicrobiota bacterium]|jgi:excinuclease ABC subunit A